MLLTLSLQGMARLLTTLSVAGYPSCCQVGAALGQQNGLVSHSKVDALPHVHGMGATS